MARNLALVGVDRFALRRGSRISIVWDGFILHTTQPLVTLLPVAQHDQIRLLHADEYNFNLTFQFINEPDEEAYFRPEFLTA